jgi:1-acyl-sn-glycerol-3-phosphate acyltransferase
MLHLYFRGRIYGAENVPAQGPLVVVSNHASDFDPPILSNCMRRPVAFMAKEELFKVPILKQAITLYGAYPVKRESSRSQCNSIGYQLFGKWMGDGCIFAGNSHARRQNYSTEIRCCADSC